LAIAGLISEVEPTVGSNAMQQLVPGLGLYGLGTSLAAIRVMPASPGGMAMPTQLASSLRREPDLAVTGKL
jgi:hypothetical protein